MDEEIGSYEVFVANRAQALLSYGYVLTGNPHDAADLMQEALVRLRTAWPLVHNKREPESFVRTTMARLHVSIWRRMRREKLVAATPEQAYVDDSHETAELRIELWAAPLAGGDAYRVSQVYAEDGVQRMSITVTDGRVYWSLTKGGVYQAPLSGGDAQLVEGTEKSALVKWPWVGSPLPKTRMPAGDDDIPDEIAYRTLRNLQTGEVRTATERSGVWTCRVQWCVGYTKEGGAALRRDGTGRRELDDVSISLGFGIQPARDRFVLLPGAGSVIYDLESGKAGLAAASDDGGFRMMNDDRLYYVQTRTGYQLVDLAAIEASGQSR